MVDLKTDIRQLIESELSGFYEIEIDELDDPKAHGVLFYGIHCMYDLDHHELVIQVSKHDVAAGDLRIGGMGWEGDDFNANYQSAWSRDLEQICMAAYDGEIPGIHDDDGNQPDSSPCD